MVAKNRRPKEYLFVDGYNIINSWTRLKKLSELNLEVARQELIEIMAEYQHYTDIQVVIVFDAHMVKKQSGKEDIIKGVRVVYTKETQTADQYIEKVLDEIGRIKKVRVATSDWMEQQIVLGRGGIRVSARELEVEIFNNRKTFKRKKDNDDVRNDLFMGRLEKDILKKLNKWGKNKE